MKTVTFTEAEIEAIREAMDRCEFDVSASNPEAFHSAWQKIEVAKGGTDIHRCEHCHRGIDEAVKAVATGMTVGIRCPHCGKSTRV